MPWHIETGRDDCDGYAVVKTLMVAPLFKVPIIKMQ